MSLLTIVNSVCDRVGIPRPTTVVGNTDPGARQLLALSNEEGQDLASRHRWNVLIRECTFTTVANPNDLVVVATGFDYILPDTVWDRTRDRQVPAMTPEQWQAYQANGISGPTMKFRIQDASFYLLPDPGAGYSIAFEYVTKNWNQTTGAVEQDAWADDTDTGILDEKLMALGLLWRWKRAKGMEYGEDFNSYERRVANAISRDGAAPHISLSRYRRSGSLVGTESTPEGSWSL